MNRKSIQLAERRQYLLAQIAAQRAALAQDFEPWRAPLALADRGMVILGYIKRYPALLLGATLMVTTLRVKHADRWLQRGWVVWQLGRSLFKK